MFKSIFRKVPSIYTFARFKDGGTQDQTKEDDDYDPFKRPPDVDVAKRHAVTLLYQIFSSLLDSRWLLKIKKNKKSALAVVYLL
jgi:hypothetical protein